MKKDSSHPEHPCPKGDWSRLADRVGDFMRYWGFKRIHGRIWTHLFLSAHPLDAQELISRLNVSKALISLSLADLLHYDVIREEGKSPRGTLTYTANPNVMQVILNVIKQRERPMLAECMTAWSLLNQTSPNEAQDISLNKTRVHDLGEMIKEAQNTLEHILELSELNLEAWRNFDLEAKEAE